VERFANELSEFMRAKHPVILSEIRETAELSDDLTPKLEAALDEFASSFQTGRAPA
jgi:F0F1-type ATP synthase alpha subunit